MQPLISLESRPQAACNLYLAMHSGREGLRLSLNHSIQLRTSAGSIDQVLQLLLASGEIIAWDDGK
jgi:hypothetical protein